MKVQIAGIVNESVTDGPGLRTTLFFQGCRHACQGCHNPQTWSFMGGDQFEIEDLIGRLPFSPLIKGVTLSGGDPFYQPHAAAEIASEYKKRGKDVWAYTGFIWEELLADDNKDTQVLIRNCDVLVDGPYISSLAAFNLPFRGSSNQRLIDVQESLRQGWVVEIQLSN